MGYSQPGSLADGQSPNGDELQVKTNDGRVVRVGREQVHMYNDSHGDYECSDILEMNDLHAAPVMGILKSRLEISNLSYCWAGKVIIALNPYTYATRNELAYSGQFPD